MDVTSSNHQHMMPSMMHKVDISETQENKFVFRLEAGYTSRMKTTRKSALYNLLAVFIEEIVLCNQVG